MFRLFVYFAAIVLLTIGLSWLADQPGTLQIEMPGFEIRTTMFRAIVLLGLAGAALLMVWSLLKHILTSPQSAAHFVRRRRQKRGIEALSSGLIAVGSGDRALAVKYTALARKSLPHEPMTHLLRAQTAELMGDRATARRIYDAMRNNPETELLGLRGLFLEAKREGEDEAARQFAERALAINPRLGWSAQSLFELQCREGDWAAALDTLNVLRKNALIERKVAERRRAVLLTAQAISLEESEMARALALALEAHGLAPDLVPAAALAGRLLASQGATGKAARILQRTWKRVPHPELATAYAFARIGDSPRDRLQRVRDLIRLTPNSNEGPIALAQAAIDAQDWELARRALAHLIEDRPSQRVCTLMARIEGGQHGDTGRVREWLARAVHAPRDPAWIADGHIAQRWAPVSPVTGGLDAFEWRVPEETPAAGEGSALVEQLASAAAQERLVHHAREEAPAPEAAAQRAPEPPAEARRAAKPVSDPRTVEDADIVAAAPEPAKPARGPVAVEEAAAPVDAPDPAVAAGAARDRLARAPVAAPRTAPRDNIRFKPVQGGSNGHGTGRHARTAGDPAPVAARAPDDPGPEAADEPEHVVMSRLRSTGGKA